MSTADSPISGVETSGKRKTIAILASFPAWLYTDGLSEYNGEHYDAWLVALHEALEHQDEFDIHWVTLCKELKEPVRFESRGQHIHVLPRTKRTIGLVTFYIYDRAVVARELRAINPDLVHSWGTEDCYGLCAKDFKGRRLHSVQGILTACVARARFPRFVRLQSKYEPCVWKNIRHITTESPWAAEQVRKLVPTARPALWEYAVEERFCQTEHKLASSPQCLYAGSDTNLNPLKNVDFLIEAFSDPRLSHVTLKLAGVYPANRPNLPSNIKAMGRVGRDGMTRLLSESWALVHMSLTETGPTIAKEARVVGLPVILSNCCGCTQYIEDGQSGFVLDPHDKEGFIKAVLAVTRDAETALAMGAHGLAECREALSRATMIRRLMEIYRGILSEP